VIVLNPDEVWVIIPAYNESQTISQVITDLLPYAYRVVVVDDGSSDETARLSLGFPVVLLRHSANLGQGAALQTGIAYALRYPETRYIVTFDADGQHCVEDIPGLLEPLLSGAYEVVLGSRFIKGGQAVNIGRRKHLILSLALAFTRFTTRLQITDTHNGIRAFTSQAASKIRITQNRMAHASEILSQIATLGLRYCEAPVKVTYTSYSRSKGQSLLDSINILWELVQGSLR
jgi:glycosyltransferase involved in cell wall biosynthesis